MKKHQKHAKLTKPSMGVFCRNEIAIIGTTCSEIKRLSQLIIDALSNYKISYIDADHSKSNELSPVNSGNNLTNKISHFQLDLNQGINEYSQKLLLNNQDLALVNGNHFVANKQIIVLDKQKEASLHKRLKQITKPVLLIRKDLNFYPSFLKNRVSEKIQVVDIEDVASIISLVKNEIINAKPPLYGLILAGGKSSRMGEDKGKIMLNGEMLRNSIFKKLNTVCEQTFYSIRADQQEEFVNDKTITDKFIGLGPFGAILSAFQQHPNAAWFVVATDLPNIDNKAIKYLAERRNPSKSATAFLNNDTNFPDPLCTIWEPKSYLELLQFLSLGYSCPRKVLINTETEIVQPTNHTWLFNMNTPKDLENYKVEK